MATVADKLRTSKEIGEPGANSTRPAQSMDNSGVLKVEIWYAANDLAGNINEQGGVREETDMDRLGREEETHLSEG
ncbi:hypothetical protein NDU88_009662 [Pleurodeles waltl]|uniref:Uncharacterized protein n=1 Tax=Pleurodeles waltl TaxID=8319 RepID=A0AAV7RWQ4_PLEWA|nr:hypothetical protein NDU88_009662 [Pleurodeles waltl]